MSSPLDEEYTALLGSPVPSTKSVNANCWPRALTLPINSARSSQKHSVIIICVLCLQFLVNFSKYVVEVPIVALLEISICSRYLQDEVLDAKPCKKLPRVQDELTIVVGWRFFFDALPALFTALLYGRLADRRGRRSVLFLSCLGLLCSLVWIVFVCYVSHALPIKLVWASSIFILVVRRVMMCTERIANRCV